MTTTPPWGTPSSAEPGPTTGRWPTQGQGPAGGQWPVAEPRPTVPGRGFFAVVEQHSGTGDSAFWRVDPAPIPAGSTREEARATARDLARTFQPNHPFSPRGRSIFRIDDDNYLVMVPGMTRTYHFRITVAELVS